MTREWGLNMRGEGRAAGAEGRAKIQENRKRQAEEERRAKIRALSSVATGKKVRTGWPENSGKPTRWWRDNGRKKRSNALNGYKRSGEFAISGCNVQQAKRAPELP
jgi:hypothetical protein